MLEANIVEQLKGVYKDLESEITLSYDNSEHTKQSELLEMLEEVAGTSDKIKVSSSGLSSNHPRFQLLKNSNATGIKFSGIPGGHEFTSFVLSILNTDLKGKLPDKMLTKRIQNLKGAIKLRTFISLSCENCPEVVQSLNIMSILKEDFEHEMIDGEFAIEETERLKIQGVPAVFSDDEMISSGKASLVDLLEKLETHFGVEQTSNEVEDLGAYDVVVIGAGPAGATSAIYTARKGLKTAVITDKVGGQMQETKGIENFSSIPYIEGPQLSAKLGEHMNQYEIDLLENRRVSKINWDKKALELNSNEKITTKSLIVATGAKWRELNVEGEKEYLGRGVAFCPHCDGPFYKGKDIAVIGGGNSGVEAAIDLAGIVKSVTVIEFASELRADQVLINKLNSLDNSKFIKNAKTTQITGNGEKVDGLEYEDRASGEIKHLELAGVFVQIGLVPNSNFVEDLVEKNKFGEILVNDKCRTSAEGIYAAGDVTNVPYKQIVISMGEGAKAGLAAFEDLVLN